MDEVIPILSNMATPVIKLEPVRMGSLLSGSSSTGGVGQKYVPPNLRTETGEIKIDLGIQNFPTLGAAPKKAAAWGKMVTKVSVPMAAAAPVPVATHAPVDGPTTLKDMIKEQIRQAELEEEERQKPKEEDPYKMTREELIANGWTILSLKSAPEVRLRLNTRAAPAYVDSSEIWLV
jgi:hypothetical protein